MQKFQHFKDSVTIFHLIRIY